MELLPLPKPISVTEIGSNKYKAVLEPLYPGYGVTIGNTLRRVLLASLPGAAITAVKIKFADHEFSTVPNIKEDVIQIILALKQLKVKSHSDEKVHLKMHLKGECVATAGSFEKNSMIEISNPDLHIATLDNKNSELDMEVVIEKGRGYVPVEARENSNLDIGFLAIDAIYTPIRSVYYDVSNVRVGQFTNYDKLEIVIETNGTITGKDAVDAASVILIDHFKLACSEDLFLSASPEEGDGAEEEVLSGAVEDLNDIILSTRAKNALVKAGITTKKQLMSMSEADVEAIEGLGKKTISEILIAVGKA